jgi:hypothetical protein
VSNHTEFTPRPTIELGVHTFGTAPELTDHYSDLVIQMSKNVRLAETGGRHPVTPRRWEALLPNFCPLPYSAHNLQVALLCDSAG